MKYILIKPFALLLLLNRAHNEANFPDLIITMKKLPVFMILFISAALLLSLSSCSKEDPEVPADLVVSIASLSFDRTASSQSFHIKSNVNWSVVASDDWVAATPSSGIPGTHKIDLSISENITFDSRSAELTVAAGDLSKKISLTQAAGALLTVEKNEYEINPDGGELAIKLTASSDYQISVDKEWLTIGDKTNESASFTIPLNLNIFEREATIQFSLSGIVREVVVRQPGQSLSIPAEATGMDSDAPALAAKMIAGWNLGNSLEATTAETASETLWGNPKTTKAFVDAVKNAGFNAVRIPCAWNAYIEDPVTNKIQDSWLARVKEVVNYVVDNDMYAILNIHWDGGWLENNPTFDKREEVNKKQKVLWEQIAVCFRDFDEHVLFAGTNEVHEDYNNPSTENIEVQTSYNQTFVDAVRSTGGRNAYRNIVIQAYNTNINFARDYMVVSTDPTPNRLMVEVHYYDPYDFTLQETGSFKTQWGQPFAGGDVSDWGQEDWVDEAFGVMKTHFVDQGFPVILGEYGVMLRDLTSGLEQHKQARNYYLEYVTKAARDNGLIPFYWDNGHTGPGGSGLFNRASGEIVHPDAVNAIMKGAGG